MQSIATAIRVFSAAVLNTIGKSPDARIGNTVNLNKDQGDRIKS
jgi:hypothetical protein